MGLLFYLPGGTTQPGTKGAASKRYPRRRAVTLPPEVNDYGAAYDSASRPAQFHSIDRRIVTSAVLRGGGVAQVVHRRDHGFCTSTGRVHR
jgi:hypothetical protein